MSGYRYFVVIKPGNSDSPPQKELIKVKSVYRCNEFVNHKKLDYPVGFLPESFQQGVTQTRSNNFIGSSGLAKPLSLHHTVPAGIFGDVIPSGFQIVPVPTAAKTGQIPISAEENDHTMNGVNSSQVIKHDAEKEKVLKQIMKQSKLLKSSKHQRNKLPLNLANTNGLNNSSQPIINMKHSTPKLPDFQKPKKQKQAPTVFWPRANLLKGLAIMNLIIAFIILLLGCTCTGIGYSLLEKCKHKKKCPGNARTTANCHAGTGVWQGVLAVTASLIGVMVLRSRGRLNRTLLTAYQAFCILCALGLWILIAVSAGWIGRYSSFINSHWWSHNYGAPPYWYTYTMAGIVLDALLILFALLYILLSIISSSLMCASWHSCCPSKRMYQKLKPAENKRSSEDYMTVPNKDQDV